MDMQMVVLELEKFEGKKKKKVLHTLQSHPVGLIGPFGSCLTDPV